MTKIYNKLVRDKILEVIEADGKEYKSRILTDKEYAEALANKFMEEAKELLEAGEDDDVLGELSDIVELVHAKLKLVNKSWEDMEKIRIKKLNARGGFDKKIFLESAEE
jgi:predicted house-cleaning noncanonical NTP pyrophosphatase (MazG superfamily)